MRTMRIVVAKEMGMSVVSIAPGEIVPALERGDGSPATVTATVTPTGQHGTR